MKLDTMHSPLLPIPSGGATGRALPLAARARRSLRAMVSPLHPALAGCAPCPHLPPSLEKRACHAVEPDFPVDVVFTWVNGADPEHAAKRAALLPGQSNVHENGLEAARFRDNEELRYSLRALERFAPWVRNVILVTDNQTPRWLRADHPKIRIVDHRDCIPHQYLPTFNSHVIEAYLHTIPDLAEQYIYFNDDFFLARPCRKTEFFTPNGLPLVFVDWRARRLFGYKHTKTPHAQSYFNTVEFLRRRGIFTDPACITAHGPYPQSRANANDVFAFFQDAIQSFSGNRFRTTEEMAFYSHALPLRLYGQKRVVPCDERYYYVLAKRRDRLAYYSGLLRSLAEDAAPLFFCVNDVGGNDADSAWRQDLHNLLSAVYPAPSSYEADL